MTSSDSMVTCSVVCYIVPCFSIGDAEMRNDSEHCQNMCEDELRVTQSSYDEATTEALSQYYSNRAAYDGRVKRVSMRSNLEREVRE